MITPDAQSRLIAEAVSTALESAGISQREAASLTGIPLTTLSRRLTGKSPLVVTELAALAGVAGVPLVEIVRKSESPRSETGEAA